MYFGICNMALPEYICIIQANFSNNLVQISNFGAIQCNRYLDWKKQNQIYFCLIWICIDSKLNTELKPVMAQFTTPTLQSLAFLYPNSSFACSAPLTVCGTHNLNGHRILISSPLLSGDWYGMESPLSLTVDF